MVMVKNVPFLYVSDSNIDLIFSSCRLHPHPCHCRVILPHSRLANDGEICICRFDPTVGHCNTLYVGSVKGHHRCSSQEYRNTLGSSKYRYYVLPLSNELFPKNISDLVGVKNELFPLLYPDFNVWKKIRKYVMSPKVT